MVSATFRDKPLAGGGFDHGPMKTAATWKTSRALALRGASSARLTPETVESTVVRWERGEMLPSMEPRLALSHIATIHGQDRAAFLLRLPDEGARTLEHARFIDDLKRVRDRAEALVA